MAPETPAGRVLVRFTSDHEDSGVLYTAGQEAEVSAPSAEYIETVAKSGHRVTPDTPAATPPPGRGAGRGKE